MTGYVTGKTGKTGFFSFLACIYHRDVYSNILRKKYIEWKLPGNSGFSGIAVLPDVMLEKDIVAAILRYLRALPRCFAWKTHGGMYGTAGIPDVVACVDGRFYGFEVKLPSRRLTRLQERTLRKIRAAGGVAEMVTSVSEVAAILEKGGAYDGKGISGAGVPHRPADQ